MSSFLVQFLLASSALFIAQQHQQQVPTVSSFSPSPIQKGQRRSPLFRSIPASGWVSQTSAAPFQRSSVVLHSTKQGKRNNKRKPSKVTDEDGPTPDLPLRDVEEVDAEDIPELREIEDASQIPPGPIPHQPWRRGETGGCEDPISAEWRVKAEELIIRATELKGGKVDGITWYLTSLLVTLDDDLSNVDKDPMMPISGPEVIIKEPTPPMYYDPEDPNPEEISEDDDDVVYIRETEEEREERLRQKPFMYVRPDEDDPEDEPRIPEGEDDTDKVGLYMNEETREYAAAAEAAFRQELYADNRTSHPDEYAIDSGALEVVASAIIEALELHEEELQVLSRHELVLTGFGEPDILQTQADFDTHIGHDVAVETQDPWQSNRVLKGRLLDRNSMDVLINKKGRMVTIPQNFVACVRLLNPKDIPADRRNPNPIPVVDGYEGYYY